MPLNKRLRQILDQRQENHLLRELRVGTELRLNFSSNDYLCLRKHPAVIRAAQEVIQTYGTGSGASPLLTGFLKVHQQLLDDLKVWSGKKSGLLFNTGFMANQALIRHLPGPNDLILADRLIHHSFAQALFQSKTPFHRYHHNDLNHLETLLKKHRASHDTVFVITESVFSMDGDSADLIGLAELKSRHEFFWILDEAHAIGVYGKDGTGLACEQNVIDQVDLLVGTLGKALGSMGAFILTDEEVVVDYLINHAGELIYSTFLSPSAAGAARAALCEMKQMETPVNRLRQQSTRFRQQLTQAGFQTVEGDSPIVPLILDKPDNVLRLQAYLLEQGISVGAVRPPTVPADTSRIRFSLHTGIADSHLDELMECLTRWNALSA